jgi:Ni,Fe-hydrogenase III small subunit
MEVALEGLQPVRTRGFCVVTAALPALHSPLASVFLFLLLHAMALGNRFVARPHHAALLLVTGPVAASMEAALRRTYEATPDPKLVVAVGDCGCSGGVFGQSYASLGRVANVIPDDVILPGCQPSPNRILAGILTALSPPPPTAAR